MLWEVEIFPLLHDPDAARVNEEARSARNMGRNDFVIAQAARGFLLEGDLPYEHASRLLNDLLLDTLVETGRVGELNAFREFPKGDRKLNSVATVLLKPGVMDPVAQSVLQAASDLGISLDSVRTFRRYYSGKPIPGELRDQLFGKILANEAIEQAIEGPLHLHHLSLGSRYSYKLGIVALRDLDDQSLLKVSRAGQLSLNLAEMRTIQGHFRDLGRDPTDIELETLAQTWSEHCSHKTLKGRIEFDGRTYENLLKETIFAATQKIRRKLGSEDWCVSVFEDNAGVVRFDDEYNVCFKVETHNHPSAIEPYGGANTGLGGVIRDPLGTGLGAKPICNTDVFCFAPPETSHDSLPCGVLSPRKVMNGVVAGVRDYGNRMGIPTINGAVCFDARFLGNPLVFCGTVGLIPVDRCHKETKPGDLIVTVGGRTGRDGIHGATFSSIELTSESEKISGGAVQIGNAITEKKVLDVILQARDRGLYTAITDCGAGGFSSAVGEMAEKLGARVDLDKAPLKYDGLSYTEIWISEAQERMVLSVAPSMWEELHQLCADEDVEATVLGTFEKTGRLKLFFDNQQVGDLDMRFLHDGRPDVTRKATWSGKHLVGETSPLSSASDFGRTLSQILASPNVRSKESIIRQYDHEVQGGSVIKPLVGIANDGPGDASVITPTLGSQAGIAVGCGINPHYGEIDPYHMAALAIDEAVRNVVAVGADPSRIALLDNFCWGNTDKPEVLGSLVSAAQACHDVALAYMMPFISGKDSLNNEFHTGDQHITIPATLLISAIGKVPDVRRCVTMDLKAPGNFLFLIGETKLEMGGSHAHLVTGRTGGDVPKVDVDRAPRVFQKLHEAIQRGLVRSCHDLSEGGLAVALAEMAFAGEVGADVTGLTGQALPDEALLFSESATRFVVEISPDYVDAFTSIMTDELPLLRLGITTKEARLRIAGSEGAWIIYAPLDMLKKAWQTPL